MKYLLLVFILSSCSLLSPLIEQNKEEAVEIIEKEDTARIELHKELNSVIFFKKIKELEALLREHPDLISEKSEKSNHVFKNIAFFNNIEALRLIKKLKDEKVIDIDIVGIDNPIKDAARNSLEMVLIFKDFGFSLYFKDTFNRNILEIARSRNIKDLENWLKENGYNHNFLDKKIEEELVDVKKVL